MDLEDSVSPANKPAACQAVVQFLQEGHCGSQIWVRINSGVQGRRDADLLAECSNLSGIWIAKAEDVSYVADISARFAMGGRSDPEVGLLIESARGIIALADLLSVPTVQHIQLGEIDLAADLRHSTSKGENMAWARHWLVTHTAAAGHPQPVAPVDADYIDLSRYRRTCISLRDIGFGSRACIHPAQADIADQVFGISDTELATANALLDQYEAALEKNRGAIGDGAGSMIDAATVRTARRVTGR